MFLARTVAHSTDVDGVLDSMTPEQFNEWLAAYSIQPWAIEPAIEEEKPNSISDSLTTGRRMAGV